MTLDEAILHAEEKSKTISCEECAKEHKQLAEWLKELKAYRQRFGEISNISEISETLEISSESEYMGRLYKFMFRELQEYEHEQTRRKGLLL